MFKKQKVKRTKQSPAAKTDKKGFRVLTDEHDLYQLFGEKKKSQQEDFGRIFEESQQDKRQQLLLQEKKKISNEITAVTVSERIKTYPAPQVELDLHGNTAVEAEKRTEAFIENARREKIRTVRIIVGKGLHSEGKAVLPDMVEEKIIRLKRKNWLLGFEWEKKDKSKSGALILYLLPQE
ncbi:Smr/MutS family protein [Acidobacteriota bacterium]